jgi:toxin ParE1/3/4
VTKRVRLLPAAEEELKAAEAFYEERAGLGVDFIAAVREAARRLATQPNSFPLARGVSTRHGVRRCPLRRFPFALFFVELPDEFHVLAIAHARRRPFYWRRRL